MSPRIRAPNLSGPGALLSSSPPQDTVVLAFATALDLVSGLATSSNAQYVPLTSSAACAGGRETLYQDMERFVSWFENPINLVMLKGSSVLKTVDC